MRKIILSLITVIFCITVSAQNRFFTDAGANGQFQPNGKRLIIPQQYRAASLDIQRIKDFLWTLPSEKSVADRSQAPILELPMPDGSMAKFHVWESSIMEAGLAAKFPEIRTFAGQGIDDPHASIRFDYNPYSGFHAQILSDIKGRVFIDPYQRGDITGYISYFTHDNSKVSNFSCEADLLNIPSPIGTEAAAPCRGTQLYTYRLALACTGEYAVAVAGPNPTVPAVAAAMLTTVNRVDGVYEKEISLRMVLVANNNLLIYLDGTNDPYTNSSGTTMLGQNQTNIDLVIGSANYDIGHVVSTGGGGVAGLRVPCTGSKARGVTGLPNPVGDNFDIDYVAHEMGHQWGGNHTFNSSLGSCGGNGNSGTAYEVGSGTTIQAYAGICGSDNTQPHSDPFFHTISFDEIGNNITTGNSSSCRVVSVTGNSIPVITAMNNNGISIPTGTPFTLTGAATDPDGDPLTYSWEQWDLGPSTTWNGGAASATAPLFKSRLPKNSGSRTFPDMAIILAGFPSNPPSVMDGLKGETLPTVARAMKFRLTVRDNRINGGGVATGGEGCQAGFTGTFQVNVTSSSPFLVTAPNGGEVYIGASAQTITWDPALTASAPINVANVRITLSTDGGLTYPTVIEASTPNDGSQVVTIPNQVSTTARVRIEALGNIFFDISNANFTINAAPNGFVFDSPAPVVSTTCPAPAIMQTTLTAAYTGSFNTSIVLSPPTVTPTTPVAPVVTLTPMLLQTGTMSTVVAITNADLLPSGSYTVTVTGTAGAIVQTKNIVFTINATNPPVIGTQPAAQTVCAGTDAIFSVVATGTYQWQVNTGAGFTNIGGATSASYTVTAPAAAANGNQYRVLVTGPCGVATSNAALLTVNSAPAITTNPQGVTLCAGASNTFTAAATGAGITYQWQVSTAAVPAFTDIPLATGTSYTVNPVTAGMNGNQYRVVVTGTCPSAAISNPATLTVVTSVTITGQPANTTVCDGATATFTAAGSGPGVIYQWQVNTGTGFVNVPVGAPYSGSTTGTLTINPATPAMSTYQYRAQLSNATCTTPAITNTATLTVNQLPVITSNPVAQTICLASNTTFTVAATGTGLTYQWQVSTPAAPAFVDVPAAAPYSGTTTATLTITGAAAGLTGNQYRALVTGTCTPAGVTSTAATLTVIVPVAITTQAAATAEICSGSNASFTVVGNSSQQPITYQWQVNTGAGFTNVTNAAPYSGANTATLTITNAPTTLTGAIYRVQLSNATCTVPTVSNSSTLTVRQLPTVGLTAAPLQALLPGQSTVLTATPSAQTTGTLTTTWFKNGASITNTGNTRTVNVENIGTYRVNIQEAFTGGLVCANQSADVVITATVSDKLFIFPSPNDGRFTVSYYNNGGAATSRLISIYDSKGDRVRFKTFPITGPYTLLSFDLRPAQKGIYYVVVGDATGKVLIDGKVLVQ